jgi:hypothetical protein
VAEKGRLAVVVETGRGRLVGVGLALVGFFDGGRERLWGLAHALRLCVRIGLSLIGRPSDTH